MEDEYHAAADVVGKGGVETERRARAVLARGAGPRSFGLKSCLNL